MIEKDGIVLRAIEEKDLPVLQSWRNDDNLRRYFREWRDFSLKQKKKWYDQMIFDDRFQMFVIERADKVFSQETKMCGVAGITYVDWVNRHGDVHFYIGKGGEWIDKRIAPVAFEMILDYGFNTMNLNKLWAEIYQIDNKKLDFFTKRGFSIDANLREHYFHKGQYYTSHILSLLKKEYDEELQQSDGDCSTP
jgi:RimJ/RimL family protein N-acetyltransferase